MAQRVGDIFQSEFERAGYNPKVAPIYANALVGRGASRGRARLDGAEAPAQGPGLPRHPEWDEAARLSGA